MAFISQLCTVIYAVFLGTLCLFVLKVGKFINRFWTLRKKLSSLPSLPRHWLLGNARKGQVENSKAVLDILVKAANEGHKTFCLWVGPIPILSVQHADTFKELIKQTREKSKGITDGYNFLDSWLGDGLLMSEGKKWERNRKLLTPAFHFDILNGYINIMNEGSNILLDKLARDATNGKSVDVFPYICETTLDAMLKCSLSYEGNIQTNATATEKSYIKAIRRISEIAWRRSIEVPLLIKPVFAVHPLGREYFRLCDEVHEFTGNIIQSRIKELKEHDTDVKKRQKRRLDFLDILLTAKDQEGRGLSPQEIQDEVDTFTFEGHDTTASAISWAIYALGKYPDLQQNVYKDVCDVLGDSDTVTKEHLGKFTYLPMFIKEVLRYYTPVPVIGRANYTEPIILDGKEIPPNVSVQIWIYAIHHNEDIWPNHMVFDPERFSESHRDETEVYGFIPFSAGSRNCIGQVFAMNEIKINLVKLVKRFEVKLDPKNGEAILLPDVVMRAENGINITLKKR